MLCAGEKSGERSSFRLNGKNFQVNKGEGSNAYLLSSSHLLRQAVEVFVASEAASNRYTDSGVVEGDELYCQQEHDEKATLSKYLKADQLVENLNQV